MVNETNNPDNPNQEVPVVERIMFRDQVLMICSWFDRWTPVEQTVAMVAILRKVQPTQARFLTHVLNKQIADYSDIRRTEILANDPNFVRALHNVENRETLLRDLLIHLPLFSYRNQELKGVYQALIFKVLQYAMEHNVLIEDTRQLLSYSLIHPAFTIEERTRFSNYMRQFEHSPITAAFPIPGRAGPSAEQVLPGPSAGPHYPPARGGSPPVGELWQQQPQPHSSMSGSPGNYGTNYQRIRRSNSLTPPVLHSDTWTSQEELCQPKPRSLSLSSEVSPQGSLASSGSGSETHLDDPRPTFQSPGMKDVPTWLKGLRLHKYSFLFAHITFEEMLALNEVSLEKQGVTKGARHKIVLSINKLRDRVPQLKQLSDQMSRDKDSLRNVLTELKWLLATPIKPRFAPISTTPAPGTSDTDEAGSTSGKSTTEAGGEGASGAAATAGTSSSSSSTTGSVGAIGSNRPQASTSTSIPDEQQSTSSSSSSTQVESELTTWIVHVIGKACEMNPDAECEALLVSILERCLIHEAFTEKQKRVLTLWRQQHTSVRRNSVGHSHFHGHHHRSSGSPAGGSSGSKHSSGGGSGGSGGRHFTPRVLNLNNQMGTSSLTSIHSPWGGQGSSIHAMFMAKRPSLQDQILESARSHLAVQRTKSAPLPNFLAAGLSTSPPVTQFDHMNPLGGGEFMGLSFPDTITSLGLGHHDHHHPLGPGHDHGLADLASAYGHGQPGNAPGGSAMSALDITSRLESLCLSMTEAALGLSCTNY